MGFGRGNRYGKLVRQIERVTEVPMLVLALLYVLAFIVEYLPDVPPEIHQDARLVGNLIIAVFAVELAVKVAVAERRLEYLRSHWLDVIIVILPFLRPLRLLVVLPFLARVVVGLQRVMGPFRGAYVLMVGLVTVLTAAGFVLIFEERSDGPIQTFGDALWLAITTITTVGYGDTYPVTLGGRVAAAALMMVGIALFSVITAGIAAYFVENVTEEEEEEQTNKLDEILARLDALEKHLEEQDREHKKNRG